MEFSMGLGEFLVELGGFLMGLGGAFLAFVVLVLVAMLITTGANKVKRHMYKRAQKNRFKKKPVAKCYCVDCKYYSKATEECRAHTGWRVADNWFCWKADPIEYEDAKHSK